MNQPETKSPGSLERVFRTRPTCSNCREHETIITRTPGLIAKGLNALRGIGEEWECLRCGHIWQKQNLTTKLSDPATKTYEHD